jgi:hypothetical protein
MTTALEDKVDRLASALERMIDRGGFSGPRGDGPGGGSALGGDYSRVSAGLTQYTNTLMQAGQGNTNLVGVLKEVNAVLGNFGPVISAISGVATAVGTNLVEMNGYLMSSSKFGIGFSQNLGSFSEKLGEAGIAQEKWVNLLQQNSQYLAGSGLNAQLAAERFLKTSAVLRQEDAVQKAVLAGIDFSEFQDQLLISTNLMKFQNLNSTQTQQKLQESVIATVREIDAMARITGASRQEVQKSIDQSMNSRQIAIAKLSLDAEELKQLEITTAFTSRFGKSFQALSEEIFVNRGRITSREGTELQAGLNTIGAGNVINLLRELRTTTDPQKLQELQTQIQYEMARATADKERMAFLTAVAKDNSAGVRQAIDMLTEDQRMLASSKTAYDTAKGDPVLFARIMAETRAQQKQEIGAPGTIPGSETSVAINAAQEGLKSIGAGLAKGIKEGLDELGKTLKENVSPEAYQKAFQIPKLTVESLGKMLKDAIGYEGKDTGDKTDRPNMPGMPWMDGKPPSKENPLHITGTVRIDPTEVPRQALGSKDVFGSWFGKDWGGGGINIMDGKEAAVPLDKVPEFISDMVAKNPNILAGLQGSLRNTVSEANPMSSIQRAISQLSSSINIPSTVSSASSANSVSGTIVESKTTSDLHAAIEKLNTKMDKLITAVEDGANANVKAVKSRGNMIA